MSKETIQTDDELLRRIEMAEATMDVCTRNIKQAKLELLERREKEIQVLLKAKDEPFGDVSIVVGNHKVKINVPKKVTWAQDQLATKHAEIVSSGSDPLVYMKVDYSVSETAFKGWPDDVKDYFKTARTVTPGNPSVKIEKEAE
jgi:hypothetical protein